MTDKNGLRIDRLRTLREHNGWSQRELARLCGLSEAQINKYENGGTDPSATFLKLIAQKLDVSTDYLLGLTDSPHGYFKDDTISEDERLMFDTFRRDGWQGVLRLVVDKIGK